MKDLEELQLYLFCIFISQKILPQNLNIYKIKSIFFFSVPPSKIIILDNLGAEIIDNILGPYSEGASINVTCMSTGGK